MAIKLKESELVNYQKEMHIKLDVDGVERLLSASTDLETGFEINMLNEADEEWYQGLDDGTEDEIYDFVLETFNA